MKEPLTIAERQLITEIAGAIAADKAPNVDVRPPESYDDARAAKAAALRARGKSFGRIGALLGVDATTIRRWLDPTVDQKYRDACSRRSAAIRLSRQPR